MIICQELQLGFIHIPKAAGSSIRRVLIDTLPHCHYEPVFSFHRFGVEIRDWVLGAEGFNRLRWFAVTRHPVQIARLAKSHENSHTLASASTSGLTTWLGSGPRKQPTAKRHEPSSNYGNVQSTRLAARGASPKKLPSSGHNFLPACIRSKPPRHSGCPLSTTFTRSRSMNTRVPIALASGCLALLLATSVWATTPKAGDLPPGSGILVPPGGPSYYLKVPPTFPGRLPPRVPAWKLKKWSEPYPRPLPRPLVHPRPRPQPRPVPPRFIPFPPRPMSPVIPLPPPRNRAPQIIPWPGPKPVGPRVPRPIPRPMPRLPLLR